MRVFIDSSVFSNEPAWCLPLFWFGRVNRHRVLVPSRSRSAFDLWRQGLGPESLRDAVDHAVAWSIEEEASNPSFLDVTVSAGATTFAAISPRAAWELLQRPYRLLLEDGVNDREFLLRMCPQAERTFLQDRMAREWLEPDHGGGISSMPRRVRELRKRGEPLLASCVFDSDAELPGVASRDAMALEAACDDAGMHRYRLTRRAIENYLPRSAIERWISMGHTREERAKRRELTTAFWALLPAQRHHWNVREALGAKLGHLFGDESAMNDGDVQSEGGPAELGTFVRELVERVR